MGKAADEKQRDEWMHELFGEHRDRTRWKPVEGTDKLMEYVPPRWTEAEERTHKDLQALDKKIDDDEQAMLHRLIDLRPGLWT